MKGQPLRIRNISSAKYNAQSLNPMMVAHNLTKAVDKRLHYVQNYCVVSLSIFGGNFALAKVCLGLISVRCSELKGVRFSEVGMY